MIKPSAWVVSLYDLDLDDAHLVGENLARLGELFTHGFPIAPGFVVTPHAYYEFVRHNSLETKIKHLLGAINYELPGSLEQIAIHIKRIIASSEIPNNLVSEIRDYYTKLNSLNFAIHGYTTPRESSLNLHTKPHHIKGDAVLFDTIRAYWISLFTPANILNRHLKKIDHFKSAVTSLVQKTSVDDLLGKIFPFDYQLNDRSKIVIQFSTGHELVVDKASYEATKRYPKNGPAVYIRNGAKTYDFDKLRGSEVAALVHLINKLEKHYLSPQEILWGKSSDSFYILLVKPAIIPGQSTQNRNTINGTPINPGIATGHTRKLENIGDFSKIRSEDIIFAKTLGKARANVLKLARGVVLEDKGDNATQAFVKMLQMPAIVGVKNALSAFQDNKIVTLNANSGQIFEGGFYGHY